MISISHLEAALAAVDAEINALLYNNIISAREKDEKMTRLLKESKVLKKAHEDICCLKEKISKNKKINKEIDQK
ncbi:MAG: hypothetical protein PHV08_02145 [Sulfurovaceae bacterium]|nr:hypothetical protein [Sulfurovaceae bacterium]